jgi:hypothetical protein
MSSEKRKEKVLIEIFLSVSGRAAEEAIAALF